MSHLRFLPNRGDPVALVGGKVPTNGQGKPIFTPAGSSLVNKSKTPPRPRGRGRRIKTTHSTPPPQDIPLPFLKLPAEVRNEIYGYLLTFEEELILMDHHHADNVRCLGKSYVGKPRSSGTVEWSYDDEGNSILVESERFPSYKKRDLTFVNRSILLVNKQIYNEARGVLFANNTLRVDPMELGAMKPARWEAMRHFTRFDVGMLNEAMPTLVDLLCSTHYDPHDLRIAMVIPGAERTRCQYWVEQVKEMLEPLRDLHVRGQVNFFWIERYLVDNPEVRMQTVEWLEKLGMDMMGGPGNGDRIVTGEERDKLLDDRHAAYHASAMAAATAASLVTTPAPAPTQVISASVSPTLNITAPTIFTSPAVATPLPATPPTILPTVPILEDDTDDDMVA